MTDFKPGDRVVYSHSHGGDPRHNGQSGTVERIIDGPGTVWPSIRIKWDDRSVDAPPSQPFTHNVQRIEPPASDPIALLRAQADALDAEANEAYKECADLQKRVWELSDKADNATRLAAQYRNVATDLEARS